MVNAFTQAGAAKEDNANMLLGEPMERFHRALAEWAREDPHFHFHYVTAREMYNLVRAAEAGYDGPVADARDYELLWNGSPPPDAATECTGQAASHPGAATHQVEPGFCTVPLQRSKD